MQQLRKSRAAVTRQVSGGSTTASVYIMERCHSALRKKSRRVFGFDESGWSEI